MAAKALTENTCSCSSPGPRPITFSSPTPSSKRCVAGAGRETVGGVGGLAGRTDGTPSRTGCMVMVSDGEYLGLFSKLGTPYILLKMIFLLDENWGPAGVRRLSVALPFRIVRAAKSLFNPRIIKQLAQCF